MTIGSPLEKNNLSWLIKNITDKINREEVVKSLSTPDEVKGLKRNLAEDLVKKLWINEELEWFALDYLVSDNPLDLLHDKSYESLWLISKELQDYKKDLDKLNSKEEIENYRNTILLENNSESSEIQQLDNSTTNTSSQTEPEDSLWTSEENDSNENTDKTKVNPSKSYEIDHFDITVPPETKRIRDLLRWKNKPDLEPFACGFKIYNILKTQGRIKNTKYLTIVDFTKKKWEKRFFVINMDNYTVEHAVKVWHWKKSGGDWAKQFSNEVWSNQSSLWGFILPDEITKSPNKSRSWLRQIQWIEKKINNNAAERWIAVHPWWENGSEWCFTLPKDVSKKIMGKIKWSLLFAYAKSEKYFSQSEYFQQNQDGRYAA